MNSACESYGQTGKDNLSVRKVYGKAFHEQTAQQLDIDVLEMDERHGYVDHKAEECWDAVALDTASLFVVQVEVDPRNQQLIESLMRQMVECNSLQLGQRTP